MRSNMIEYMDIFVHVVESGSFTRAAELLELHRPAVSKSVQQLEDELGVKLLHRTTRKLNLTEEGREFYQHSKQLLGEVSDLMAAYSPTLPPKGRLRLDAPLALVHTVLIPALADFQAQYPDIDIVLTSSDRKIDLIQEGIDCVIRLGELDDSSYIVRRMGGVRMVTCAAPAYLKKQGTPRTLNDLQHHKAVNFFSEHSREVMGWKFMQDGKIVILRLPSAMLVDNSDALLSCGLTGLGIIQATYPALAAHLESGALVELVPEYACEPKPVSILYPDRRHLAPKVRVFVEWFSQLFSRYSA